MMQPVPVPLGWAWVKGDLNDARLFMASPDLMPLWEPFHVWLYRFDGRMEVHRFFRNLRALSKQSGFAGLITETCADTTRRWANRFRNVQVFGERRYFSEATVREFYRSHASTILPMAAAIAA